MGRRRVAVVATVLVAVAAGTGVARAYFEPGAKDIASPEGYFSFCSDRQRDTAGITPTDLTAANYRIDNYVYDQPGPLAGQGLLATDPFVLSKSGIDSNSVVRRVVTTQRVEYADAGRTIPVQIRCKLRSRESIVRPENELQRFDPPSDQFSSTPWGFGSGAATGTPALCRTVQEAIVASVWASLSPSEKAASPFPYGTPAVVIGPENLRLTGVQWTTGFKTVAASAGVLTIADNSLLSSSADSGPGSTDRLLGAYYCTFVAPEYLRSVFLGGPVV